MKKFFLILTMFLLILCASCISVSAMDPAGSPGTVLYHQDFGRIRNYEDSGLKTGALSSDTAAVSCEEGPLSVKTPDSKRVYLLFPPIEKTDSCTLEFTFRFTETPKENGYLAAILTCRGTEPTNITDLVIRADGTVDDFSTPDEAVREAIAAGKPITVTIPVEGGVLHRITLQAEGAVCTLERDSVLVISSGGMGLAVRNSSAEISEIYLVNGTGYAAKTGEYAEESFADDGDAAVQGPEVTPEPEEVPEEEAAEESPATGDDFASLTWRLLCVLSAGAVCKLHCRDRKRRRI